MEQVEAGTGKVTLLDVGADAIGATLVFTPRLSHGNGTVRIRRASEQLG
jgi:hypothetical protein